MDKENNPSLYEVAVVIMKDAFASHKAGDIEFAQVLFYIACDMITAIATGIENLPENEPKRSILYYDAACLAFFAQQYEDADKLIDEGLKGDPPPRLLHSFGNLQYSVYLAVCHGKDQAPN
jgi:hypothetical protein